MKYKLRRQLTEKFIESILFLAAASSVLITFFIVYTLVTEAFPFFKEVKS